VKYALLDGNQETRLLSKIRKIKRFTSGKHLKMIYDMYIGLVQLIKSILKLITLKEA